MSNKRPNKRRKTQKRRAHSHYEQPLYLNVSPLYEPTPEFIAAAREEASAATTVYQTTLNEVLDRLPRTDALSVLASLAFYSLKPVGQSTKYNPDWKVIPHHVELFQSLALRNSLDTYPTARPVADDVDEYRQWLPILADAARLRYYGDLTDSPDTMDWWLLREAVRNDTHRNRSGILHAQSSQLIAELCAPLDNDMVASIGMTTNALLGLFTQMHRVLMYDRPNGHMALIRRVLKARSLRESIAELTAAFDGANIKIGAWYAPQIEGSHQSPSAMRGALIHDMDLLLPSLWSFTTAELIALCPSGVTEAALIGALNRISYEFGDLRDHNIEHFFLDSPVSRRPFIRLTDDLYCLSLPHVLLTNLQDMFEELIASDAELQRRYEARRAIYLEEETHRVLTNGLPGSIAYRNSQWRDTMTGQQGENDLTVQIGGVQLIIEAKSGRIPAGAFRGGRNALSTAIRDLIAKPAQQTTAFSRMLAAPGGLHTFTNGRRAGHNMIDTSTTLREIHLTVLLDDPGVIFGQAARLSSLGHFPPDVTPQATVSLPFLRLMMDQLPSPSLRLHFLARRQEIESELRYNGDDLDLLALYIATGLDLRSSDGSYFQSADIYGFSNVLEELYSRIRAGAATINEYQPHLSTLWSRLLPALERKMPLGWGEMAIEALRYTYFEQQRLERELHDRRNSLLKGTAAFGNVVIVRCHHNNSLDALAGVIHPRAARPDVLDDVSTDAAMDILHETQSDRLFLITMALDVSSREYGPSRVLCLLPRQHGGSLVLSADLT